MAKIRISHEHSQPEAKVREIIDQLIGKLDSDYDIKSSWHGHRVDFHRSGASGTLTLQPHRVEIEIKLSMFLSMFEPKIRDVITGFCQEYLP